MQGSDEVCLCFHVTKRNLEKFVRLEKPVRASQMSQCYGAGTGCGWCRPYLAAIFESGTGMASGSDSPGEYRLGEMTPEEYAELRMKYRADKKRDSD